MCLRHSILQYWDCVADSATVLSCTLLLCCSEAQTRLTTSIDKALRYIQTPLKHSLEDLDWDSRRLLALPREHLLRAPEVPVLTRRRFNSFFNYTMPLFGAFVADTYLGRFRTIWIAVCIAILGHIILTVSAIPSVMAHPNSAVGCVSETTLEDRVLAK